MNLMTVPSLNTPSRISSTPPTSSMARIHQTILLRIKPVIPIEIPAMPITEVHIMETSLNTESTLMNSSWGFSAKM